MYEVSGYGRTVPIADVATRVCRIAIHDTRIDKKIELDRSATYECPGDNSLQAIAFRCLAGRCCVIDGNERPDQPGDLCGRPHVIASDMVPHRCRCRSRLMQVAVVGECVFPEQEVADYVRVRSEK